MRNFCKTTLAGRIIVTLCGAMTAFWLLSESIAFYYTYQKTKRDIVSELTWELESRIDLEDRRYLDAEQHAQSLLNLWSALKDKIRPPGTPNVTQAPQAAVFVPFGDGPVDAVLVERARSVVGTLGTGDTRNWTDTFILLPGQGVVLHRAMSNDPAYLRQRARELAVLATAPVRRGFRWGAPMHDPVRRWHVSVAAVQPGTGVMAGFSMNLDSLAGQQHKRLEHTHLVLQSDAGTLLPLPLDTLPAGTIKQVLRQMPRCDGLVSTRLGDFHAICKPLSGPPWKAIALYPVKEIANEALAPLRSRLPLTFIAQFVLLAIMLATLWKQLAQPLRGVVEVIDKAEPADLAHRLPEGRQDELGRIARSYNALLKTVAAHYKTLERKVRERTRELDEAKRQAELANKRKSEHITSISHEIRTPLNGIVGALSLLQRSELAQEQQELVGTALQSSGYLLGIINNLLDFSRIEAGQLALAPERVALLSVFDQAMLTVALKAREKNLALRTTVMPGVPHQVVMDELRVRQILINLLGNAIKFTRQGHIHLVAERRGECLAITVEDTGSGIARERQIDIFRPFVQVRAHDNGSGLGLAIASHLAGLMGGEILLESEIARGSRFTLVFPLQAPVEAPVPTRRAVRAPLQLHAQLRHWGFQPEEGPHPALDAPELAYLPGRLWQRLSAILQDTQPLDDAAPLAICPWALKVLLVDDVAVNLDIVGKMLRQLGHRVVTAGGGNEALALGRQQVFDLVLMDVRMPDMDGLETTRRWRDPGQGMLDPASPIVALTANALPAERERVKAAGMNDYLAKPVTLEQLALAVEHAIALQLERGVDLAPNQDLEKPLLDTADDTLGHKLHAAMTVLHKAIDAAWQARQRGTLLDLLHSLKGCAGQGGIDLVREAAEQQETQVVGGAWPSREDIRDLARLIGQAAPVAA